MGIVGIGGDEIFGLVTCTMVDEILIINQEGRLVWILPKQLHTSPYVQDMGELTSGLNEQSQICEQSLLVRSKPTLARTWLRKWNRDSWTQLLFGRILKPSRGNSFGDAWTSSLEASLVSRSQVPESVEPTVTHGTCSPISSGESQFADLPLFSSKMSKESSAPNSLGTLGETQREHQFCSMSLGNWKEWVIQQRQQYARRLKLAHLTREKECLSWPSVKVSNGGDCPSERRRHTPNLETAVPTDGQQDQEKPSTTGSRQGWWATPIAGDWKGQVRSDGKPTMLCGIVEQWATPQASDYVEGSRTALDSNQKCLGRDLKQCGQWRSPSASDGEGGVKTGESIEGDDHIPPTSKLKLNPDWVCTLMGISVGWVKATPEGSRVDELRLLGNGVVPATCERAWGLLVANLK